MKKKTISKAAKSSRAVKLGQLVPYNYYEGASYDPIRDWGKMPAVVHEDLLFSTYPRQVCLARLRKEVRNNPFLAGLVFRFPHAIGFTSMRSRTSNREFNKFKNTWWHNLVKTVEATGMSLRTTEEMVWRELLIAGEIFLVKLANGQYQVIESEYCGSFSYAQAHVLVDGVTYKELNGILYDANNLPAYYRFGKAGIDGIVRYSHSTLVEAKNCIHVYRRDRVNMGRGLPWLMPSMTYARDLYEMTRAKFKQIKDANSLFAFLEKEGAAKWLQSVGEKLATQMLTTDSAADSNEKAELELKPGTVIGGEPGEKLNIISTQYYATDHRELTIYILHAMSAPLGIPVEMWFSGLGDVSFAGFKGIGTNWDDQRREHISWFEGMLLDPLQGWLAERATAAHELPKNPDGDHNMVVWGWGPTPVLDMEREAKALLAMIESGAMSIAESWERQGKFVDEELEHRRQFYIDGVMASDPETNPEDIVVPLEFLFYNRLPGMNKASPPIADADPAASPDAVPAQQAD